MQGHDLAEVDAVAPAAAPGWAGWRRRAGRCARPGRTTRPARRRTPPSSTRLRRAKPHVTPSAEAVGHREPQDVGLHPRRTAAIGRAASRRTGRPRSAAGAWRGQLDAQVAGARGQVGDQRAGLQVRASARPAGASGRRGGTSSAVDEVVAGGDGVEHLPRTACTLASPSGRRVAVSRCAGSARFGTRRGVCRDHERGARLPDCAHDRLLVPSRGGGDPPQGPLAHGRRRPARSGRRPTRRAQATWSRHHRELRQIAREDWGIWLPHMPPEWGGMGLGPDGDGRGVGRGGQGRRSVRSSSTPRRPTRGTSTPSSTGGHRRQKEKYLRPLCDGTARSCFAMTEPEVAGIGPDAHPDLRLPRRRRVGRSTATSGSSRAPRGRSSPSSSPGPRRIRRSPRPANTAFLVDLPARAGPSCATSTR